MSASQLAYPHVPLFPLGPDETPYRKLTDKGVGIERIGGKDFCTPS